MDITGILSKITGTTGTSGLTKSPMKFFLSSSGDKFQLPMAPPEFEVSVDQKHTTININNIGEALMLGKSGLMEMTIESFFPAQEYYFADVSNAKQPYAYIEKLLKWKDSGKPMRMNITSTGINKPFVIQSLSYKEQDGSGDVYYSLKLKEYKYLTQKSKELDKANELEQRVDEKQNLLDKITVYPGDDMMDVAFRAYGAGDYINQYKNLAKSPLQTGEVLTKALKRSGKNVFVQT